MTRDEWLTSIDPYKMLHYLAAYQYGSATSNGEKLISDRKERLFACACCRHPAVWPLLTDERSRSAVEVAERYADGTISMTDLLEARVESGEEANHPKAWAAHACASEIAVGPEGCWRRCHWGVTELAPCAALLRATVNPYAPSLPAEVRTPLVVRLATGAYEERQGKRACVECYGRGRWIPDVIPEPVGTLDCPACHGEGTIDDGTLDTQRPAVLSDALEEAGLPETVDCPGCVGILQPDRGGLWPCRKCGAASWEERGRIPHPLLAALREQTPRYRGFWALDLVLNRE